MAYLFIRIFAVSESSDNIPTPGGIRKQAFFANDISIQLSKFNAIKQCLKIEVAQRICDSDDHMVFKENNGADNC